MTIKEFAQLCSCTAQTLRYYDKIGLLKPAEVDPWSGYRHYDPAQAVDFVKIKNLQAADFTIDEIKSLLTQPGDRICAAFERKIVRQEQKLERIREIQKSYLSELNAMEQIICSMTEYLLSQCAHPEVLTEFGLTPSDAPAVLACLRSYLNDTGARELSSGQVSMTVNEEVVHGREAVLDRIHSLTEENLADTILLNTGLGCSVEHTTEPAPDFSDYDTVWERKGWDHVYDFIDAIPALEPERIYCLWLRTNQEISANDLSVALFFHGAVLFKKKPECAAVNCSVSSSPDRENHFKLLLKKR